MSTRVACQKCGASILPATAERTGGLCMPCKEGRRRDLEGMLAKPSKVLSMDEYLALVRGLPLPTAEQRREFVEYVTSAHSWYKHLPTFLPGAPFNFFIDGAAGCDWVALRDGSYAIAEREEPGFHYSDIPTAEYRTRFGSLSYSCEEGTAVFALGRGPMAMPRDKVVAIPGEDAQPCCLPQPILDAGRVELTNVIHPTSTSYPFWTRPEPQAERTIYWPAESGGQTTLEKIFERCAEMDKPEYNQERQKRAENFTGRLRAARTSKERMDVIHEADRDPVLSELIEPERRRQKTEMLKAIDRVCMLVDAIHPSAPDRGL